jgi:hypothetical protein
MDVVSQHAFFSIHAVNDFNQHSHVQCSRPRVAFTSQSVHLKPLLTFDRMFQCLIVRSRSAGRQPVKSIQVMRISRCTCEVSWLFCRQIRITRSMQAWMQLLPYAISKESKDRCNSI